MRGCERKDIQHEEVLVCFDSYSTRKGVYTTFREEAGLGFSLQESLFSLTSLYDCSGYISVARVYNEVAPVVFFSQRRHKETISLANFSFLSFLSIKAAFRPPCGERAIRSCTLSLGVFVFASSSYTNLPSGDEHCVGSWEGGRPRVVIGSIESENLSTQEEEQGGGFVICIYSLGLLFVDSWEKQGREL